MIASLLLFGIVPLSLAVFLLQIVSVLFVVLLVWLFFCGYFYLCSFGFCLLSLSSSFFLGLFVGFVRCGTSSRLVSGLGFLCSALVGFFSAGGVIIICTC